MWSTCRWSAYRALPVLALLVFTSLPVRLRAGERLSILDLTADTVPIDERTLTGLTGRPSRLVAPDRELLEALRRAMAPARSDDCRLLPERPGSRRSGEPDAFYEAIPALLDQAQGQLFAVEFKAADRSLEAVRQALPCVSEKVPPEMLRRLFLLEAVAHVYKTDGMEDPAFQDMLAVDPRLELDPALGPDVRKAFLQAAQRQTRLAPRTVTGAGDQALFLDGAPASTRRSVHPGRHLIQRRGPLGVYQTALVQIEPGPRSVAIDTLGGFDEATHPAVAEGIAFDTEQGELRPRVALVFRRYLEARGEASLTFVAARTGGRPGVWRWTAGRGLEPLRGDARVAVGPGQARVGGPSRPGRSGAGTQAAVGIGMLTLPSPGYAFLRQDRTFGYTLRVDRTFGGLEGSIRLSLFPHHFGTTVPCAQVYDGEGTPSAEQVAAAAACLTHRPPAGAALGLARPLTISGHLRFVPTLRVVGMWLPDVLFEAGGSVHRQDYLVAGAGGAARIGWTLVDRRVRLAAEIEAGAGLLYLPGPAGPGLATPVEGSTNLSMAF